MSNRYPRRLTCWAAMLLAAACVPSGLRTQSPPHVVMVIIDTLRADRLGCYGFPRPTSPEIDRLAADGVRFARVISQSRWTRPSVASMWSVEGPSPLGEEQLRRLGYIQ